MGVTVTAVSTVNFTTNQNSGAPPLTVNFADTSTPGGTAYAWNFGTGQGTGTGATTSHTYNTAGTYTVSLTVTYPTGDVTHTKVNYITVASGLVHGSDPQWAKAQRCPGNLDRRRVHREPSRTAPALLTATTRSRPSPSSRPRKSPATAQLW